jgi:hypothetical protein
VVDLGCDMVGAGRHMVVDASPDRGLVAPGDQRVNLAITAAVREVAIVEAQPAEVGEVVRLAEEVASARRPSVRAVAILQDHLLLDRHQWALTESGAGRAYPKASRAASGAGDDGRQREPLAPVGRQRSTAV